MGTTFKGFEVSELIENAFIELKKVNEEKLFSKLDGMLNTDNAYLINDNSTIYYTKGFYKGDWANVDFVMTNGTSIYRIESCWI